MRIATLTLAVTLALLAVSPRQDADASVNAWPVAAVNNPFDPAIFEPVAHAFPQLSDFVSSDELAVVAPQVRNLLPLTALTGLPPLMRFKLDSLVNAWPVAAVNDPFDPAIFEPVAHAFPQLSDFVSFDELAVVAPQVRNLLPLTALAGLPPLMRFELESLNRTPGKADSGAVQPELSKVKEHASVSREALAPAYVMPGAVNIHQVAPAQDRVRPAEPMVDVPALPPRRPRVADRAPVTPSHNRIVFASFTLPPIGHTVFCLNYPADCRVQATMRKAGPIILTHRRRAELKRINAEVNHAIRPVNVPGVIADRWLISPQSGDCNDYAVTKRHKLLALGWPSRDLLLAEVVTSWGEHHLVLVVRTDKGDLVADSLHKRIRNWADTPYRWVRVETPSNPKLWAKIQPPEPRLASEAGIDNQL